MINLFDIVGTCLAGSRSASDSSTKYRIMLLCSTDHENKSKL